MYMSWNLAFHEINYMSITCAACIRGVQLLRGGGLGSRPIFKKFHETYAPS